MQPAAYTPDVRPIWTTSSRASASQHEITRVFDIGSNLASNGCVRAQYQLLC